VRVGLLVGTGDWYMICGNGASLPTPTHFVAGPPVYTVWARESCLSQAVSVIHSSQITVASSELLITTVVVFKF
jgi:hypothetical protein